MGFMWNPYSLPELKDLPKAVRKRIWKTAWEKSRHRWQLMLAGGLMGGGPWLLNMLLEQYHLRSMFRWLLFLLIWMVAFAIYHSWVVSFLRPRVWEQIPGLCPDCGYDIRATAERCPECGRELTLTPSSRVS